MPPLPLDYPPGFRKVDNPHAAPGRFIDGDKIRPFGGKMQKWAGWNKLLNSTVNGKARGSVAWTTTFLNTDWSVGTHLKLYVLTGNDTLTDITPIRKTTNPMGNNPFATTNGSNVVTVTDTLHGAGVSDFVTYSGASAVAGLTISGEFQIATVIDVNTYTIIAGGNANATTTGGGAAVVAVYQINTGLADGTMGLGYGAGTYGSGTYGTQRTTGIPLELRTWSMDIYANNLMCSPSGGGLYQWRDGTDTRAVVIANSPASIRAMFVTAEGFIFTLGTSTPMTVQWPDQIDDTIWTPAQGNTANSRVLFGGSRLMGGLAVSDGISLVWSDTNCFLFQYTGAAVGSVYDSRLVGDAAGLGAPLARAKHNGVAYWMSPQINFHMWNGFPQDIPNVDDIRKFVQDDMDVNRITKTWARYDPLWNQVRWHYVSLSSPDGEPDKYVDVYLNGHVWTTGTINRLTGSQFRPGDSSNLQVDSSGVIFAHDEGKDDNGSPINCFITYAPFELADGDSNMDVMGIIPSVHEQVHNLSYELTGYDRPSDIESGNVLDSQIITVAPSDKIADARLEARLAKLTIRSNVLGGDFRLGKTTLEMQPSGARR